MIIRNANVFLEDHRFHKTDVEFDEKILSVGQIPDGEGVDAEGRYLVPGLIDIHTHGAMGGDPDEGTQEALDKMAKFYAANGVTSFCATTVTMPEDVLTDAMHAVRDYVRKPDGAKCIGAHLEGPFICEAKKGAMNPLYIRKPDFEMLKRLNEAAGGKVVTCIVAPDMEGGLEFVEKAKDICSISVGHTMADYETAKKAYDLGATRATHLFNAMPGFLHREPAVVGAAMDSGVFAELICDGHHIHPSMIRAVFRMFPEKVVIITDSLQCAGMPEGYEFEMGNLQMQVRDGAAFLLNQNTLTGSVASLSKCVKNVIEFGISPEDAILSASENPAKAVGAFGDRGSVSVGKCADLVLMDPDWSVSEVFIDGKKI